MGQYSPLQKLLISPLRLPSHNISPSFIQVYRYPRQHHTAISILINKVQFRPEEGHSQEDVDLHQGLRHQDLLAQQGQ